MCFYMKLHRFYIDIALKDRVLRLYTGINFQCFIIRLKEVI